MATFQKPTITVEQSPWQTFFDKGLDTILNLYSLNRQLAAQREERDWKSIETQKERKWEESLIYLQDKLADKNIAQQQNFELRKTAREIGVLGVKDRRKESEEIITDSLESIRQESADIEDDINLYYTGLNVGSYLDENESGRLEEHEIDAYVSEQYPGVDVPNALTKGLQAWTMDPLRRAGLKTEQLAQEMTTQQLEEAKKRFEFLPDKLQAEALYQDTQIENLEQELKEKKTRYKALPKTLEQEEDLRDTELKLKDQILEKGTFEIDLLDFSIEESILKNKQMKQALTLGKLQIEATEKQLDAATLQIDSAEFEQDVALRERVIQTTGEALVGNLDAQVGIAAGIMSNIVFKGSNGKRIPVMTLLTEADAAQKEEIKSKIMDSQYSGHIKQDILDLMEAYYVGKGEDQISDYSIILDRVEEIQKLDEFYQVWLGKHKAELTTYAISEGWDSFDNFMSRIDAHNTMAMHDLKNFSNMYGSPYDVEKILKAVEWGQTGIFDDMDALEDARQAKEQFRHLSSLQEQAQLQNVSSALMGAQSTYSAKDSSAILAPFDIIPRRSDRIIDDIFDVNEPEE